MNDVLLREAKRLVELLAGASETLGDLPFASIHSVYAKPGDIDAALKGVFRLGDSRFELMPPIDWWHEPYEESDGRAFFQNSFVFADPVLADPRAHESLRRLAEIFADWLAANLRDEPAHPHRYAWHDHAAAGRLVYMAFVLREGVRRDLLDASLATSLAAGALDHIAYLLEDENYIAHSNHGLFSDAALALAARSLEPAPQARDWAETAKRRFAAVLEHTVSFGDALHLEHSPHYHWIIHHALERFAAARLFESLSLTTLVPRMEESGAWLLAPDGTLPPIGDTPEGQRPPRGAQTRAATYAGLRAFVETGYAAVREGSSVLLVTAAHHPTAHKHADDGSFCLYEDGRPLIIDSGDPGYHYESPERRYGTSPAAHSTICVDDFDWTRESPAYGSGLLSAVERDGLYAVLTRNPGAVPGGRAAQRVFVYAPRRFLIVIDDVDAEPDRLLARHLPLAPDLSATATPSGEVEIRRDESAVARLTPFSISDAEPESVEITIGRRQPEMAGFSFPSPSRLQPRCDITLAAPAEHPRVFALTMGTAAAYPALRWRTTDSVIECEILGISGSNILMRITDNQLELLTP